MSIKISYTNNTKKNVSANTILFVDEKFNINSIKNNISTSEFSYIHDLLKTSDLNKKFFYI